MGYLILVAFTDTCNSRHEVVRFSFIVRDQIGLDFEAIKLHVAITFSIQQE